MTIDQADVHRALDRDELVPYFQPQFELRTGKVCGFEVLARWNHPAAGPILPGNFIALAEQSGRIGDLTRQVFRKAFLAVRQLPELPSLAVNISPLQLSDVNLARDIEGWAADCGYPACHLTVEVTESALLHDLKKAKTILRDLKAIGCRLALDDFGTGYSSLAHLQSLPFDQLKIDRSFVAGMTRKRESRKIVAAVIGLAHSLEMAMLAEGVETEAQAEMLLWLGCELAQGWLCGRASPADQLSTMLGAAPHGVAVSLIGPEKEWAVSSLEALPTQRLAQLQAIYDGAPVGLCFLDRKFRYVSLNQRLAERNGNTIAAHLGRTVAEMLPAMFPAFEPYLLRTLAGESIPGVEFTRGGVDGAPDWVSLVSYQPAFDEAKEVIGISISSSDITEQKRAHEALHESEYVQRHMGELSRQIPWVMDAEGNNLQISSHSAGILPAVQERARILGWQEAVHPDDLESTLRITKDALRTGRALDVEYRIQTAEGEWRWMRSRGSPRFGDHGEIKRWYGSVEDIHESRLADSGLRESYAKIRAALAAIPVAVVLPPSSVGAVQVYSALSCASFLQDARPAEAADEPALRLVVADDVNHAMKERRGLLELLERCHPTQRAAAMSGVVVV